MRIEELLEEDQNIADDPKPEDQIITDPNKSIGTGEDEPNEEDDDEDGEETTIYDDLNELTGFKIEGEFADSVEGYAEYSKQVYAKSRHDFEAELKENYPKAYRAMLHEMNGCDPADLFKEGSSELSVVDNEDAATLILKKDLSEKGLSEKMVDLIIAQQKEDGVLVDEANKVVKSTNEKLEADKQAKVEAQAKLVEQQQEIINKTATGLQNFIAKGIFEENGIKTIIPESDKKDFTEFLMNSVQVMADGSAVIVHKIESLSDLKYDFFRFKRGNLGAVVEKKAGDLNAKRLRRLAKGEGNKPNPDKKRIEDIM